MNIAVTGMAAWTCFGQTIGQLVGALAEGRSGARPIAGLATQEATHKAMQIAELDRAACERDLVTTIGLETARAAFVDAAIEPGVYRGVRMAVMNGSSNGSAQAIIDVLQALIAQRRPDPRWLSTLPSWTTRRIARSIGARGPNITIDTACSTGLNTIGQACQLLTSGAIDCALAGASDVFSDLNYAGFSCLGSMARDGCRPFDEGRGGISLGDGAAYVVLEREDDACRRGAHVHARVTGYASVGEGYHATAPDPRGTGALQVMRAALDMDGHPHDLAQISAHGTATIANDSAELHATENLVRAYGLTRRVFVYALKSQIGHTLGAAGAVQVVAAIACMQEGLVPGTRGLENPIPHDLLLVFPTHALRPPEANGLVLCNAFGFGGSVASLAMRPTV